MSLAHPTVQTMAEELDVLSGKELFEMRKQEEATHHQKDIDHRKFTHHHWKQDAAIRLLLKSKCVDDTGEHDWIRHNHPYSEQYCSKCMINRQG